MGGFVVYVEVCVLDCLMKRNRVALLVHGSKRQIAFRILRINPKNSKSIFIESTILAVSGGRGLLILRELQQRLDRLFNFVYPARKGVT